MTETILLAIQAVSFVVIVIIMAVMANTMAMTARERHAEYATLKALGFPGAFVAGLIIGRVARDRARRRRPRHRAHAARGGGLHGRRGHALPRVHRLRAHDAGPARRRRSRSASSPRSRRRGTPRGCRSSRACAPSVDAVGIPLSYVLRNLAARRLTTLLTAGGMALVVYVFATVLMLAAGLRATLVATGQPDNVVVIRRSAQTEVQSGIDRLQAGIVESLPDIATGSRRDPAGVQGAGGAHQPAQARDRQAVERDDPRRDAQRASSCARRSVSSRAGCSGPAPPRS